MKKKTLKKKMIIYAPIIVGVLVVVILSGLRLSGSFSKGESKTLTVSTLIKTVDIAELSTAQFTYNGIAEVYKSKDSDKIKCRIRYEAIVKAGVNMDEIDFKIDPDKKTVKPILPQIQLTANIVDENKLSFIPEDTKIEMREALLACENDVQDEVVASTELYDSAEENLKDIIEALIYPIVEPVEYEIVWE